MTGPMLASENDIAIGAVISAMGDCPFQVAFKTAQPTLNAVRWLRPCFKFIDACSRTGRPLFRPQEASTIAAKLPTADKLAKAGALFDTAVTETVPEAWLHAVLALMVDSQPSPATADGWRFGIADTLYRDPDGRGYSPPVIVQAVRAAHHRRRRPTDDDDHGFGRDLNHKRASQYH